MGRIKTKNAYILSYKKGFIVIIWKENEHFYSWSKKKKRVMHIRMGKGLKKTQKLFVSYRYKCIRLLVLFVIAKKYNTLNICQRRAKRK